MTTAIQKVMAVEELVLRDGFGLDDILAATGLPSPSTLRRWLERVDRYDLWFAIGGNA